MTVSSWPKWFLLTKSLWKQSISLQLTEKNLKIDKSRVFNTNLSTFFYLSFFFFFCLFCSCCWVFKSCLILQNLADSSSPPGSSVHIISQQQYWSVLPLPSPGDLLDPGTELVAGRFPLQVDSSSLQIDSLPLSHQGSPLLSSLAKDCLVIQDRKCSF